MSANRRRTIRDIVARALQRVPRYRGMLVLVLWQAPVGPVVRSDGSVGFMFGGGMDEIVDLSCEGNVLDERKVSYMVAAVDGDYDLSRHFRIAGVLGAMSSSEPSFSGMVGSVQLRGDWKYFGIGAGIGLTPNSNEYNPSAMPMGAGYLRAGRDELLHVRADILPPTAFGGLQMARVGLGYNAVRRDLPSGFLGLAALSVDGGLGGVAGDLSVPMNERVALRVQGHYGTGFAHPVAGLAVGGRLLLPARPAAGTAVGVAERRE